MLRRIVVVPLLVLALACNSEKHLTSDQKTQFVDKYTELAGQYYLMGELDRAEGQCQKGLALDPDKEKREKLELILAWTLQRRGKTDDIKQAIHLFRGLQDSGDNRALLGLAESLERYGVASHEAAVAIQSGKRITDAPDPEKRAAEHDATAEKAWLEARDQYKKFIGLAKKDPDGFNGLMRVETLLGHPDDALSWAEQLVEVTQDNIEWHQKQIQRPNMSTQEEKKFHDILRSQTTLQVATHRQASELCMALGKNERALEHIDAALKLDATQPELYSRRAQILKDLGRYQDAIADITSFIGMSRQDFQHPDMQRAWRLRTECEDALRRARAPEARSAESIR